MTGLDSVACVRWDKFDLVAVYGVQKKHARHVKVEYTVTVRTTAPIDLLNGVLAKT